MRLNLPAPGAKYDPFNEAQARRAIEAAFGTLAAIPAIKRGTATFATAATVVVAFTNAEPDTTYQVTLGPRANEAMWVTAKTAGGFTINSANATSTALCDWTAAR